MLHLKIAQPNEAYQLIPLLRELHEHSIYKDLFPFSDVDTLKSVIDVLNLPKQSACIVTLNDDDKPIGLIAMGSMDQLSNRNHRTAIEIAFWIKKEYMNYSTRTRLLRAYKYWAKQTGCTSYSLGKFTGYNKPETYVIRKL